MILRSFAPFETDPTQSSPFTSFPLLRAPRISKMACSGADILSTIDHLTDTQMRSKCFLGKPDDHPVSISRDLFSQGF
jgi:hypothetical protein